MTAYADSDFYEKSFLCGKKAVIDTAFDYYANISSQKIKQYTFNNIDENNIPDIVKMCCCDIAEQIFRYEKASAQSSGKSSESVKGWSVSYESREQSKKVLDDSIKSTIRMWLADSGLMYAGVRKCL